MPQAMTRSSPSDTSFFLPLAEPPLDMPVGEAMAMAAGEERPMSALPDEGLQVLTDLPAQKDHVRPIALGFPQHQDSLVEVDIPGVYGDS